MIIVESVKKTKSKEIHTLCVNHEIVHTFYCNYFNKKRLIQTKYIRNINDS
jgi:hypothetical protein